MQARLLHLEGEQAHDDPVELTLRPVPLQTSCWSLYAIVLSFFPVSQITSGLGFLTLGPKVHRGRTGSS